MGAGSRLRSGRNTMCSGPCSHPQGRTTGESLLQGPRGAPTPTVVARDTTTNTPTLPIPGAPVPPRYNAGGGNRADHRRRSSCLWFVPHLGKVDAQTARGEEAKRMKRRSKRRSTDESNQFLVFKKGAP